MLTEALPLPAVPGASPRWPFWGCGHHGEPLGASPPCLHIKPETPINAWAWCTCCPGSMPWGHAELLGVCSFPKPQDSSSPSEAAPWSSPYPAEMQI